jgi:hypothetical protein
VSAAEFLADLWATMGMPDALARIERVATALAPAAVPLPTVAELMALPVIARDFREDIVPDMTALAIAMHAQRYAEIAVEVWEDQHSTAGVMPVETVLALADALDAAAWRSIYTAQTDDTHVCRRCGERIPDGEQPDGCEDYFCEEIGS